MQLLLVRVDHSPVWETKNKISTIEWENILKYHLLNHLWHTVFIQTCHSMNWSPEADYIKNMCVFCTREHNLCRQPADGSNWHRGTQSWGSPLSSAWRFSDMTRHRPHSPAGVRAAVPTRAEASPREFWMVDVALQDPGCREHLGLPCEARRDDRHEGPEQREQGKKHSGLQESRVWPLPEKKGLLGKVPWD